MMTLHACEEVSYVDFFVQTEGFTLEDAFLDQDAVAPAFDHYILGGVVTFSGDQGSYRFDLRNADLEKYSFSIPQGTYLLEFSMPPASLYGQQFASFIYEPAEVVVNENTDTIRITVEANCALFLVDDSRQQLDQGVHMIKRYSYSEGYFTSYPLALDELTGLYYAYFTPDPVGGRSKRVFVVLQGQTGRSPGWFVHL